MSVQLPTIPNTDPSTHGSTAAVAAPTNPTNPVSPVTGAPYPPGFASHQRLAFDRIVSQPYVGVWLGVGTGKTLTTLRAIQHLRPAGHLLVIAPIAIARSTWIDQIREWNIPLRARSLIVNERDKKLSRAKRLARYREVFTDPPTMYFINIELVADLVANMPLRTITDADGSPTEAIVWPFPTVIIDESQTFKSHKAQRFKALAAVRPAISRLIELTGTPAPEGLHDLWSQVYLLDQGLALGPNITTFRNRFFTSKQVNGIPVKFIPNYGADQQIYDAIDHLVMSAQNTELVLPDVSIEDVTVTLPADVLDAYQDFRKTMVLELLQPVAEQLQNVDTEAEAEAIVRTIVAENQAVLSGKLLQFASGTQYVYDEVLVEPGEDESADPEAEPTVKQVRSTVVVHEEKLRMLEYLIRNTVAVGPDHKTITTGSPVLVTYNYQADKEQIMDALSASGLHCESFDGSRAMVARWNNGEIPVMLLHPAAAGHGINLQHGGHTLIWYTLPFRCEHYLQANGRLHRTGQTKPVQIYRLIAKGTFDTSMPVRLREKELEQLDLIHAVDADAKIQAQIDAEFVEELTDIWRDSRL